jgi:predicted nucleic acid-binding protein
VVYLDSSVALAHLLAEDRRPAADFWNQTLIGSRLVEYEVSTRLNNLRISAAAMETATMLLQRIALIELVPEIVRRARDKYPMQVRTLDALHLASIQFLREQGVHLELATYDVRMREAAVKLKIPLHW